MGNLFVENQTRYEFIETADGSPSICMTSDVFRPEAMHHREGALSESLFVYDGVLEEALALDCPPRVLSVGLGCGYNELIALARLSTSGINPTDIYIESFEGDSNLRANFLRWLLSTASTSASVSLSNSTSASIPTPSSTPPSLTPKVSSLEEGLWLTYERVLHLVAGAFKIAPQELKFGLRQLHIEEKFFVREWLTSETTFDTDFGVIFFDAFSGKSTPGLWSEEFLKDFLKKTAAEKCGLATYAATGTLNRALRATGFELRNQKGFAFKRESTRAFKTS